MTKPTFDEFADLVEQAVDQIPPRFCRDLTGGFNVQRESRRDGKFFIMGEYVEGGHLGCFIVFYYGSFAAVLGDQPHPVWDREIRETVLHEMQHHIESLAGRDDLARQEKAELAAILRGEHG
ncbi:MAG: metallopeptidase family protein [Solirubrobacterales bacterium]